MKSLEKIFIMALITGGILSKGCISNKISQKTPVVGEIENIWMEENIYEEGVKGVNIYTEFILHNLDSLGEIPLGAIAYFYDSNLRPLRDMDGKYCTNLGNVSARSRRTHYFKDNSDKKEIRVFMPYNQLDLKKAGVYGLKVDVILWDLSGKNPRAIARSKLKNFEYYNIEN